MRTFVFAFLCGTVIGNAASAGVMFVPTDRQKVVFIHGNLSAGDHRLFRQVVTSAKPDIVALGNPAGRLDEAAIIAADIRSGDLNTVTIGDGDGFCTSVCALMFLAGKTKYALPGVQIGVHDGSGARQGIVPLGRMLLAFDVPSDIISSVYGQVPARMHWLTEREAERIGIVPLDQSRPIMARPEASPAPAEPEIARPAERREYRPEPPVAGDEPQTEEMQFLPVPEALPERVSGVPAAEFMAWPTGSSIGAEFGKSFAAAALP